MTGYNARARRGLHPPVRPAARDRRAACARQDAAAVAADEAEPVRWRTRAPIDAPDAPCRLARAVRTGVAAPLDPRARSAQRLAAGGPPAVARGAGADAGLRSRRWPKCGVLDAAGPRRPARRGRSAGTPSRRPGTPGSQARTCTRQSSGADRAAAAIRRGGCTPGAAATTRWRRSPHARACAVRRAVEGCASCERALSRRRAPWAAGPSPRYTHLQPAQPVLLAHCVAGARRGVRARRAALPDAREAADCLPLGAGAVAGTPLVYDRVALATRLGFAGSPRTASTPSAIATSRSNT